MPPTKVLPADLPDTAAGDPSSGRCPSSDRALSGRTLSGRQLSFQRRKKKAEANGEAVAPPVAAPAASAAPAEIDEAPIMSVTMRRKSIEIY